MKTAKRILVSALAFLWLISMSACSASEKGLTMDALLKAETRDDIIELLGEPSSSEDLRDYYDSVEYLGAAYVVLVSYLGDAPQEIHLAYFEETKQAKACVSSAAHTLTETYGEPDIWNSPVNTTTYTWNIDGREIELQDNTDNEVLADYFPYYIAISY